MMDSFYNMELVSKNALRVTITMKDYVLHAHLLVQTVKLLD